MHSAPNSAPNSTPNSTPNSAPNSPPQKLKIASTLLPDPLTSGTTGTITQNVPIVPVIIDSVKNTNEDSIPDDASEEVPVDEPDSIDAEQCTDGTNTIDSRDVNDDPNSGSESESDSESIEEALTIESNDSDFTSSNSNSNGNVDAEILLKSDSNNSNSKVPEDNMLEDQLSEDTVDLGLDIIASEVVAEKSEKIAYEFDAIAEKPETPKKKVRRKRNSPFNQELPTSSTRSLRAKRSIRNESFNSNFSSLRC